MKPHAINAIGKDGNVYALIVECEDMVDCENIIKQLGLVVPDGGFGEIVETKEWKNDEKLSD